MHNDVITTLMTLEEKQERKRKTLEAIGFICDQMIDGRNFGEISRENDCAPSMLRWIVRQMNWDFS